ncbi:unnamed protein product [Closterium sp. NIES-53]
MSRLTSRFPFTGPAPSGVSQVDPLPLAEPVEVTVDSGAAGGGAARGVASWGAELAGAEPEGAEPASAEPGGAEPEGAEPGGAQYEGAESGSAEPRNTSSAGGPVVAGGPAAGGTEAGGAGATRPGSAGVTAGARGTGGAGAAGPGGAVLEVLELPELVVLEVLELETLELEALEREVLELEALELETLELEALELETLELEALELETLELEALELEALELEALELETLEHEALELETLALEALELEELELEALELDALALEVLELEELELEALDLEALELETLEVEVLALGVLELAVLVLEALCSGDHFLFHRCRCLCRHLARSFAGLIVSHSPLPAPSPYVEQTDSLTKRREPDSHPASPVCVVRTGHRVPRPRPPSVPDTHIMALRPPASSLADNPDPESDLVRAANPTVTHLLATIVTNPSFESAAASALVAELVDFAAAYRLDYAASLVAESESDCPLSVGDECALGTDILEDRQEDFECLAATVPHLVAMLLAPKGDPDAPDISTPRSYAEAITGPYSSQWQTAMDAEMASWKSTGTYVDAVPTPGVNIVDGMWIFRGVDFFQTFSPTPKMTTLRVLLYPVEPPAASLRSPPGASRVARHTKDDTCGSWVAPSTADPSLFLRTDTSLPPFCILVYVDDLVFATANIEALALVNSELQKRHTCTDLGELRSYLGLQITRDRARRTITLTQSHMVQQVLQRFGFRYSSPHSTPMPTGHSLSAPPSNESIELSGPYSKLVACLITSGMRLVLGGRGPVVLTGHADASWVNVLATQRSSQGYTFSLGSGFVSWRSTRSSSVLSSSCEAEIYARAMAAQELRWLTYLLTDLGKRPRSSPVLYVDNKAMIALCQEHRLKHIMKYIALRYFLARELQQHGQLRFAYVATRAIIADIFFSALQLGDHQRFSIVLGLVPTLPHLPTT